MNTTRHAHGLALEMIVLALCTLAVFGAPTSASPGSLPPTPNAQTESPKPPVPDAAIIEPQDLARILKSNDAQKPLIFHVGFHLLFKEGHIPGSEYLGPASKEEGLALLRKRVARLPHSQFIVLYCGCCPWIRCPNVKPAYQALRNLGFEKVKVLRIDQNFGADWVTKGYPVVKGE